MIAGDEKALKLKPLLAGINTYQEISIVKASKALSSPTPYTPYNSTFGFVFYTWRGHSKKDCLANF